MLSHFEYHHKSYSCMPLNISQYNYGQMFLSIIQDDQILQALGSHSNNKIPATNTSDSLCFATRIGFGFANFVATKTIKMIVSKKYSGSYKCSNAKILPPKSPKLFVCVNVGNVIKITEKAIIYYVCV